MEFAYSLMPLLDMRLSVSDLREIFFSLEIIRARLTLQ
jgi:hypothetical protein